MFQNNHPHRKIVFLHIPKTGGTSLHTVIHSHFDQSLVFHALRGTDVLAAAKQDFAFYSGHLYWPSISAIPNRFVFTVFREPVGRVLSEYFYLKGFREEYLKGNNMHSALPIKRMSLTEYILSTEFLRSTNNPQVRHFLDEGDVSSEGEIVVPDTALEKAISRIDELDVVGLFEKFDLSVALIFRVLGLKHELPIPRLNVTDQNYILSDHFEKVERSFTTEHIEMLRERNQLDFKIYEHAKSRFYSLMRQHLPEQSDFAGAEN